MPSSLSFEQHARGNRGDSPFVQLRGPTDVSVEWRSLVGEMGAGVDMPAPRDPPPWLVGNRRWRASPIRAQPHMSERTILHIT